MKYVKGALMTLAAFASGLAMFFWVAMATAYPESTSVPRWAMVIAGAALWGAAFVLISKMPDKS